MKFSTDYWQKTESYIEFFPSHTIPDDIPVSAVKLISIVNRHILLVDTPKGWDIPGGHVEPGEGPDEALSREIEEETGGVLKNHEIVGYLKITNQIENELNKNYPKVSCIVIYQGGVEDVAKGEDLVYEAVEAKYWPLTNLPTNIADWSRLSQEIIEYVRSIRLG